MNTQEHLSLLQDIRREVLDTLNIVAQHEPVLSDSEGELSITWPSLNSNQFAVTLNSYILVPNAKSYTWRNRSLKQALEQALTDVKLWCQIEQESPRLQDLPQYIVDIE